MSSTIKIKRPDMPVPAQAALAAHEAAPQQEPVAWLYEAWFQDQGEGGDSRWMPQASPCEPEESMWTRNIRPLYAAPQQAQAPERLALDLLCGLAGEVSTDYPMTAAERIFDHVQAERAAHVQELKNYRRNLEGRDALIARWRAGMKEIIPQRMGAEEIRERLQSLLRGDVPQQGSNT